MKIVPLSKVLRHRKDKITIDDSTDYKLCRVQLHRRGVVLRQMMSGAKIRTKTQQVCKRGDFIVAEMDAKVGGYGFIPPELDGAIVSNHYYLYEVDVKHLHPPYLWVVCQAGILQQQIVAKGSTNYASVRSHTVLSWTIPLPDMNIQIRIAKNFEQFSSSLALLNDEITHQEILLAKLKQAILQEAIQGKLTVDWRKENSDVEPASQLLERIQKEKQRLIAEKKIRKEKPLPPITSEEIPFEIPDSWAWCRFGKVIALISGQHIVVADYNANGKGIPYLPGPSDFGDIHPIYSRWTTNPKVCANAGDILVTVKGSGVGKINSLIDDGVAIGRQLMAVRRIILNWGYLWNFLASEYHALQDAKEGQIPGISREDIIYKLIPVPSLAEQAAIVERVEVLMDSCRQLESEIKHSRTNAENLLQAVLKEAFTSHE